MAERKTCFCPKDGTEVVLRHSPKWGDTSSSGDCPTCRGRLTRQCHDVRGPDYIPFRIEYAPPKPPRPPNPSEEPG